MAFIGSQLQKKIKPRLIQKSLFSRGSTYWNKYAENNGYGGHEEGNTRSPYAILKIKTSATKNDIKFSFRKLAKQYHPDLNPQLPPSLSQKRMSEIIQAYNQLMDDGFLSRVGDARVALACEMFTLDELRIDRFHDVYSFRILYEESDTYSEKIEFRDTMRTEVNPIHTVELMAHPDDSISDLKRKIQSLFKEEWGLSGRRVDRDNIATGWEMVKLNTGKGETCLNSGDTLLLVMSYHLFLHSYDIQHGDVIYAVVRKYDE